MQLTDWVIILAIALILVAFFCRRHLAYRSLGDRAQKLRGIRLLVQATIALWAALFTFERGLMAVASDPFGLHLQPHARLGIALALTVAGCLWSIRGGRLLRQRRMFRTS
jgi:hypothetical protein